MPQSNVLLAATANLSTTPLLGGLLGPIGRTGSDGSLQLKVSLLSDDALLHLGLSGLGGDYLNVSLLDPDGDGLVSADLLGGLVNLGVVNANSLISLGALNNLITADIGGDVLVGVEVGGPIVGPVPGSPDPSTYERVLIGTDGRDDFVIDGRSTFVAGKGGLDTAHYAAEAASFTYAVGGDAVIISDGVKTDYLDNVERITFFEGTLALDVDAGENAGVAYRLYQAAFARTPDSPGYSYWLDKLDSGVSTEDIAYGFIASVEFRATYGTNITDQKFVNLLYMNVLQRPGESNGLDYWTQELASGRADRADVLYGFSESQENIDLVAPKIDDGIFFT